ncbi:unnamed protein product [Trifolium pratense]|uniref:Uncharacterized protein n=1 Tax=Trifolium pratense TaxID=57577 RepID=A0ACB0LWP1_TRIPR|nr:unnamed protein product [Trifolium pratense]
MVKMGFAGKWMRWTKACIFNSSMSVLVNGSPTGDFKVGKGLRQGDPLSPFLFLIAAEGLTGMVNKAVDIGKFVGYKVNDDTVLLGEASWDNVRTIKTILRGFELVSGLKINFVKSKMYGINVDANFLAAAASFLSCSFDSIPFKFLGISVGANPRRQDTWQPIVDSLTKRLSSWSGRNLSIGGRITLINSVLSSLPLYFFSFYKAPRCIINKLVRIQRNFLWGGGLEDKKLCWIKWEQVCIPKDKGGLGVKDLELFSMALLCKWKWRCLNEKNAFWFDLLCYRYGSLSSKLLSWEAVVTSNKDSIWWRDVAGVGGRADDYWFPLNVSSILGKGDSICFWKEKWFGDAPLRDSFPLLFEKELHKDRVVSSLIQASSCVLLWNSDWLETLSQEEGAEKAALEQLLFGLNLYLDREDRWRWTLTGSGIFSVKSAYIFLHSRLAPIHLASDLTYALRKLWKNDVPSKVGVFGWRLLLEKLPTRAALASKGILTNSHDLSCVFCFQVVEDCNHVFLSCHKIYEVWRQIFLWLGFDYNHQEGGWIHFLRFGSLVKVKKGMKVRHLIWLATTWCIWRMRNNILFRGEMANCSALVDSIKFISWLWFSGRAGRRADHLYYNWCANPLYCLQSI